MLDYLLRRVLLIIPTLLGITLVVFAPMVLAPGGISIQGITAGQNLKAEERKALEAYYSHRYGLDLPAPLQYLRWLNSISPIGFPVDAEGNLGRFSWHKGSDLGMSFRYGRPVMDLIAERLPITLWLNLLSLPLIYGLALAIGIQSAIERGKPFDIGASFGLLALWSVPTMLTGVLLIGFFANTQYWYWFPPSGLSQREALNMPFLPHWNLWWQPIVLIASAGMGVAILSALGYWQARKARSSLLALLGIFLGVMMAYALPEQPSSTTVVFLAMVIGTLLGGVGWLDYRLLRQTILATLGCVLGMLVAHHGMTSEMTRGFLFDRIWHLVLPVVTLSYGSLAFLAKLTRGSVLENFMADYVRTARAKGVSESGILWRHVFRNSLLPLITVTASLLPSLISGSVIIESIFSIEGMGKLSIDAVMARDYELVLSLTLISALLTLVGYLLADIGYAVADPRIHYN